MSTIRSTDNINTIAKFIPHHFQVMSSTEITAADISSFRRRFVGNGGTIHIS